MAFDSFNYRVPGDDFAAYVTGSWKRNLEWRGLGGAFPVLKSTNLVTVVEDVTSTDPDIGESKLLRWSFGRAPTKAALRTGYITKLVPDVGATFIEFSYEGQRCTGTFRPDCCVATLQFFKPGSTVTVTYRPLDADTMAVVIVEVTAKGPPTLQFGNMLRMATP